MSSLTNQIPLLSSTPTSCQRCESWPSSITGPGQLYLRLPQNHIMGKLLGFLKEGWSFTHQGNLISLRIDQEDISAPAMALGQLFTPIEQKDVRVIFQADGANWGISEYMDSDSLDHFIGYTQTSWLKQLVEEDRLTTAFHPIVHLEDGEIFAYECLLRGIDSATNQFISPARIFDVARHARLLFQTDLAARRVAIRNAAIQGITSKVFVNFTPTAIYDPRHCLRSTIELIRECGLKPEQVVFEVIESENVADVNHLRGILDYYRSSGFSVALDDLGAGYSSLNLLSQLRPDFIKLDRALLTDVHIDSYKATITSKLLETAHHLGIATVAEGIESAGELEWLRQHGATYAQGFYFAKPELIPPSIQWP